MILLGIIFILPLSQVAAEPPLKLDRTALIRAQLAEQLQRRPVTQAQLEPYHRDLLEATEQLADFLATADPEIADGWRDYLHWDALVGELSTTQIDLDVLSDVLLSFRRYRNGLELAPFQQLQQALQAYIHEARVIDVMAQEKQFDHCLNRLADALARYESSPNYPDAHTIGRELYCLEKSIESGHEAIDKIREQFQHPNLYGKVSVRLINRLLERDLAEETVINEVSNRRTTRGRAITSANLTASMQADPEQATIDLLLRGQCRAPATYTEQGQITIRGSFLTDIAANKRMLVDKTGIRFLPADVQCTTSVQFHDISANRLFIERIARRRAPKMRPEAEAEVSQQTELRIEQELNSQAEESLQEANHLFVDYFCAPNRCYGTFPEMLRFSTTLSKMQLHAQSARKWQLGSPQAPPALDQHDLGFAIHESMIGNYAEGLFGGKQLTDRQWLNCLNTLTGSEPRPLWVHDRTDRWSLTFNDERPLVVAFRDDRFRITLRIKQCKRNEEQLNTLVDITSTFRIETTNEGPVLFRDGDVSVELVDATSPSTKEREMLHFLRWKFRAVMPEALYFDGLVPPTGGSLAMLHNIKANEYSFQNGWMRIGYRLVDPKVDASL